MSFLWRSARGSAWALSPTGGQSRAPTGLRARRGGWSSAAAGSLSISSAAGGGPGREGRGEPGAAGPALARRAGMESAEAVVAAARAGNQTALEALHRTADYLAL